MFASVGATILVSALLFGCPKAPLTIDPPKDTGELSALRTEVESIRRDAEELHRIQAELVWIYWVDGAPVDLARTYSSHERLLSEGSLAAVSRLSALTDDSKERMRLETLEHYLLMEQLARETAEIDEQISEIEASATIDVDGRVLPYREAGRLLANESDWHRRRAIHRATLPVIEQLTPLMIERQSRLDLAARKLGYESVLEVALGARRTNAPDMLRLADEILERTREPYLATLSLVVEEDLGLPLERFGWADIPHLFRAGYLDSHFKADDLVPRLETLLAGLELPLYVGGRVRMDTSFGPRKNPRAICIPVSIPDDIRLSIKPTGGLNDYQSLFHEAGHALHFASMNTDGFELRYLGDTSVGEAFAFLFESVIGSPLWLMDETGMEPSLMARAARLQTLERLYLARRHAAKVTVELSVLSAGSGEHDSLQSLYAEKMGEAYGFPLGPEDSARWAVDQDDLLYAADYLRAFVLEAQIARYLVKNHGARWWTEKSAGTWMREQWALGSALTAEGLAREVGARRLDPRPLAQRAASLPR